MLRFFSTVVFLVVSIAGVNAVEAPITSKLPLGVAFDGRVVWVTDTRARTLEGYDVEENLFIKPRQLQVPGVRDIAFFREHILAVHPQYLFTINPLNGYTLDRIYLADVTDPVGLALNGEMAYIFDRKSKKVHRVNCVNGQRYGSFDLEDGNLRGATYYKGALWVINRNGRVIKLDATTGRFLSFIPVHEDSLGVEFIHGKMHLASPEKLQSIDFIQTDNYVAASMKSYNMKGSIAFMAPWPQQQMKKEPQMQFGLHLFTFNARQRYSRVRLDPRQFRLRRMAGGDSSITVKHKAGEVGTTVGFSGIINLYDLTYILNSQNIKDYFQNPEPETEAMAFIKKNELTALEKKVIDSLKQKYARKPKSTHPYQYIQFLKQQKGLAIADEVNFLREASIAAREVAVYDLVDREIKSFLQVYIAPLGWVYISDLYNPQRPKEFPLRNSHVVMYIPETFEVSPAPYRLIQEEDSEKFKKIMIPVTLDLLKFEDLEFTERSLE